VTAAVFPGSFDPLTKGHTDIIQRSLKIFKTLHVAVLDNPAKATLFSLDERVDLVREVFKKDKRQVKVHSFSGLLVDFVRQVKAQVIVRGLRAISDYDYEAQMALVNRNISDDIETLFLITSEENAYVSSSIVRQVAMFKGNVGHFVPKCVEEALKKKFSVKRSK
jgi:pantetheine-phosphate adenylyltransferase